MEGEDRRDRLARLNLERLQSPPTQGWRHVVERARDGFERFFAFAGWEKGIYVGGLLVVAVVGLGAMVILLKNATAGGGESAPSASLPEVHGSPTATPVRPTPTTILIGGPQLGTSTPAMAPNRQDCEAIRGTDYLSEDEHVWFTNHCVTQTSPATPKKPGPPGPVTPSGGGTPPTPTPAPAPSGLSSSEAVWLAADWIPQHMQYTITLGSCTPVRTGNHWVVTCFGSPPGCDSSACQVQVSVCAFADPPRVVSSSQC